MSDNGAVVDMMVDPSDLKLSWPDFAERIMEPAMTRLKHNLTLGPMDTIVSIRIVARGLTEMQLAQLATWAEESG